MTPAPWIAEARAIIERDGDMEEPPCRSACCPHIYDVPPWSEWAEDEEG